MTGGPRPKYKPRTKKSPGTALVVPDATPPATMPGFSQFTADDYTVKSTGKTGDRYLTVSPLRAIMAEQEGQTEHVVTERTRQGVLYGAGLGMDKEPLARILGLDVETLERLYATELKTGVHLLMSDIQTNLFNIARDPNHAQSVRSGMFLLGKLGNNLYREERKIAAAQVNPQTRTVDVASLSDDQRDALREILTAAMRLAQPGEVVEGEYTEAEDDDGEDVL